MLVYTASFDGISVSTAVTLLELTAASDHVCVILSAGFSQSSDYGDAQAEGLRVVFQRYSADGSAGTSITPRPHMIGYPTAGATVVRTATPGTSSALLYAEAFNIQAGFFYRPVPEERVYVSPSGIIGFEIEAAPTDGLTMSGYVTFGEIGG